VQFADHLAITHWKRLPASITAFPTSLLFSLLKIVFLLHIFLRKVVTKLACDIDRGHAMSDIVVFSKISTVVTRCPNITRNESDVSKRIRGCRQRQLCSSHLIRRVKWWWRQVSRFHPNWPFSFGKNKKPQMDAIRWHLFFKDWKRTPNNDGLRPSFVFWLSSF